MSRPLASLVIAVATALAACSGAAGKDQVAQPAKPVDLELYLGRWYELARYDMVFERGCEGVTADYSLRPDGKVRVLNTCRKGAPDGPVKTAEGKARVVPDSDGAKLKVAFFGPFWADYWVLDRADDYSWAIVGEPSRKYLWILSRDPTPGPESTAALVARVAALGYDTDRLHMTEQPPR
ncbi:MAG TPA: lipocalin family protein [Caulobacter sp.]|nr:lipocalin family protein [Caulobacter sp.]